MARTSHERFLENALAFTAEEEKRNKRERRRSARIVFLPFLALILFMAVTRNQTAGDAGAYENATKWAEARPDAYEMTYTIRGADGASIGEATVDVQDEQIVGYRTDEPQLEDAPRYTVSLLLFEIESIGRSSNGEVTDATYDEELGYPLGASFDPDAVLEGDEWAIEVTSFESS